MNVDPHRLRADQDFTIRVDHFYHQGVRAPDDGIQLHPRLLFPIIKQDKTILPLKGWLQIDNYRHWLPRITDRAFRLRAGDYKSAVLLSLLFFSGLRVNLRKLYLLHGYRIGRAQVHLL